jgi:hypothetical protein
VRHPLARRDVVALRELAGTTLRLLPADLVKLAGSSRVRSIPLNPPAHVTGCVITVADHLPGCVEKSVGAFRDVGA